MDRSPNSRYPYRKDWEIQNCPEIIKTKQENIILRANGEEEIPVFEPTLYGDRRILWGTVKELFEENHNDIKVPDKVLGEERLEARHNWLDNIQYEIAKEVVLIDETRGTWEDMRSAERRELCLDVIELCYMSSRDIGPIRAGLYMDFNRLTTLFDMPGHQAKKIVQCNLWLGNMATLYGAAHFNMDPIERCGAIRKMFITAVKNPSMDLVARKVLYEDKNNPSKKEEVYPGVFLKRQKPTPQTAPEKWDYELIFNSHRRVFNRLYGLQMER